MVTTKEVLVEIATKMYSSSGEMLPLPLVRSKFSREVIDLSVSEGLLTIVKNPYGIGDDFIGLADKEYPKDFGSLMDLRASKRS